MYTQAMMLAALRSRAAVIAQLATEMAATESLSDAYDYLHHIVKYVDRATMLIEENDNLPFGFNSEGEKHIKTESELLASK